ncbi:MAG TPA: hypothetical protein VES97_12445 [Solirubrobacteraceae bacterium]|nr:hypothetical protein [Solirubrobacteraceae bacterium]
MNTGAEGIVAPPVGLATPEQPVGAVAAVGGGEDAGGVVGIAVPPVAAARAPSAVMASQRAETNTNVTAYAS